MELPPNAARKDSRQKTIINEVITSDKVSIKSESVPLELDQNPPPWYMPSGSLAAVDPNINVRITEGGDTKLHGAARYGLSNAYLGVLWLAYLCRR